MKQNWNEESVSLDELSYGTKESKILMLIYIKLRFISILKHTTLQQLSWSAYFYYFSFSWKKKTSETYIFPTSRLDKVYDIKKRWMWRTECYKGKKYKQIRKCIFFPTWGAFKFSIAAYKYTKHLNKKILKLNIKERFYTLENNSDIQMGI